MPRDGFAVSGEDIVINGRRLSDVSPSEQSMFMLELAEYAANEVPMPTLGGSICIFGMDDVSIAGDVISDLANESSAIPIPMICDNRVPGWVSDGVTCVIISYDGDDKIMAGLYEEIKRRGSRIVCMTSGGGLADLCRNGGDTLVQIPGCLGSRGAVGYVLGAMSSLVQQAGIMDARDMLMAAIPSVTRFRETMGGEAEKLAAKFNGHVVAMYSTSDIHSCSKRWRQLMGSDLSFYGELPEFDHNELVGWSDPNEHAGDILISVLNGGEMSRFVSTIVECMIEVLRENGRDVEVPRISGCTSLERNLCGMVLLDEVSRSIGGMTR